MSQLKNVLTSTLFALSSLVLSSSLWAEQKIDFANHELHYIVLNTTEIPAEIAKQYDISRSRKRAFINLSILEKTADGYGKPVAADVSALQRSLVGQRAEIELQEIREGDAIYYIGDFHIINREILWFDVALKLEDGVEFDYSFSQQVWQE